jgi:hypothetical protein
LATGIADRLGCVLLRSDSIRKDLAGVAHTDHAAAPFGSGIYDAATTEATYRELIARARLALERGESVVLDASWAHAPWRAAAAQLGDDTVSNVVELCCEVAPEVGAARIAARQAIGEDVSDATAAIATEISTRFDPWPSAHVIPTSRSPGQVLASTLDLIDAR